jgi:hypothetical protein
MSTEGLITLEQVVQDETKIKAPASSGSFQGEARIGEHLERVRRRVREMGNRIRERGQAGSSRRGGAKNGNSGWSRAETAFTHAAGRVRVT